MASPQDTADRAIEPKARHNIAKQRSWRFASKLAIDIYLPTNGWAEEAAAPVGQNEQGRRRQQQPKPAEHGGGTANQRRTKNDDDESSNEQGRRAVSLVGRWCVELEGQGSQEDDGGCDGRAGPGEW